MNLEEIEQVIQKEPNYRKKQIKKCLFQDLISDWSEAAVILISSEICLSNNSPIFIWCGLCNLLGGNPFRNLPPVFIIISHNFF